jgi:hypothetical protein
VDRARGFVGPALIARTPVPAILVVLVITVG